MKLIKFNKPRKIRKDKGMKRKLKLAVGLGLLGTGLTLGGIALAKKKVNSIPSSSTPINKNIGSDAVQAMRKNINNATPGQNPKVQEKLDNFIDYINQINEDIKNNIHK